MDAIEVGGLVVHTGTVSHPLLGQAHVIEHQGRPITAMSAIDWDRPTQIPTVAEPRKLPRGSGSLLMNEIAIRARRAGVPALRYAGPYPTHALFASLLRSFRTDSDPNLFTADVLDRAMRLARDEIPFDFVPAPFERRVTPRGYVDRRDGQVDRASIDGVVYDEEGTPLSIARLEGNEAVLSVGELARYATIAKLDDRGDIVEGPHPIPTLDAPVVGQAFPAKLREQLAETIGDYVPAPLAADVQRAVRERTIRWADLGWRSATATADGFALHGVIFTLLVRDMAQFALQVSYHLSTIVQATVLDELLASLQ